MKPNKIQQSSRSQERRFYLVKILNVQNIAKQLKLSGNKQPTLSNRKEQNQKEKALRYNVSFEIGCRESNSLLSIKQSQLNNINSNIFSNDMHIFPFQKEQVMSVKFYSLNSNRKSDQYGYALVPLTPFIKLPYTKHQIQIDMIFQKENKATRKDIAVTLTLELNFLHNFKGRLFIEPIEAQLTRNLAEYGQMTPKIKFYVRDAQAYTEKIQEGGIKPHWRAQKQSQFFLFNFSLESVSDDVFLDMFYSKVFGQDQLIGKTKIDLQQEGVFKNSISKDQFLKFLTKTDQSNEKNMKKSSQKPLQEQRKHFTGIGFHISRQNFKQYQIKIKQIIRSQRQKIMKDIIDDNIILSSKNYDQMLDKIAASIYNQTLLEETPNKAELPQVNQRPYQIKEGKIILKQEVSAQRLFKINEIILPELIQQIKHFVKAVESSMKQINISLFFQNKNQKGQVLQRKKQIGQLTLRYMFIYEFDVVEPERTKLYQ